jgi:hypothetical protein
LYRSNKKTSFEGYLLEQLPREEEDIADVFTPVSYSSDERYDMLNRKSMYEVTAPPLLHHFTGKRDVNIHADYEGSQWLDIDPDDVVPTDEVVLTQDSSTSTTSAMKRVSKCLSCGSSEHRVDKCTSQKIECIYQAFPVSIMTYY